MAMSTALPLDESAPDRAQPWILHILEVNTMNFCSFAACATEPDSTCHELLIAVPNTLDTEAVDIFQLPSQNRQYTVSLGSKAEKKGMAMSLDLFWLQGNLALVAAYESGLVIVARLGRNETWDVLYTAKVHGQPVLSLDVSPQKDFLLTSGADAVIAKHPIPTPAASLEGPQHPRQTDNSSATAPSLSLLSAALSSETKHTTSSRQPNPVVETQPLKTINTKHSGQQSLRIRSDGKIFATAGWDSKVRVYSAKTMTELAVLKWHEVGCYAIAFAAVTGEQASYPINTSLANAEARSDARSENASTVAVPKLGQLSVKDRRIKTAKEAHWLAAGSKDGKISLWDIY
ncbi:WD40 repeat-like protein [Hypoxylon sp. FL1284]|nr:WD40 repeat-like protein [Hypoxylon sp. FL1284]